MSTTSSDPQGGKNTWSGGITSGTSYDSSYVVRTYTRESVSTATEFTVDISSYTGSYYVKSNVFGNMYPGTAKSWIYKVWLEK